MRTKDQTHITDSSTPRKLGDKVIVVSPAKVFQDIGYYPHDGQMPFHLARQDHRMRLASCGRRFGKSEMGGHELTVAAQQAYHMRHLLEPKGRRHEYWIVGPTYSDSEKEFRKLYNDVLKLEMPMDHPGTYYSEQSGSNQLSLFGGRFLVTTKSAERPDTLIGEGLQGIIAAEAAKLKPTVWTKSLRPTLADYANDPFMPSWASLTSTPEGKNWFYDLYQRGQSMLVDDRLWWSIRRPSWTNNVLFPLGRMDPEILDMERDMSEEKFKQEIGADFTEYVGQVFKDFELETHVGEYAYDPKLPTFLAQDYGWTNPTVVLFLQVDVFNNVKIVGEYYRTHRTAEESAADVWDDPKLGPMARAALHLYPDPASPGANATQASKWQVQNMGDTGGAIQDRLELIRRWLKPQPLELPDGHVDKKPKLVIDRSCTNTVREMQDYRYPENKREQGENSKENPMKADDHSPEALGRFFAGFFGKTEQAVENARVSTANLRARAGASRRR
jgi:hypothetical protein